MTGVLGGFISSIRRIFSWSSVAAGSTTFHQFAAYANQANSRFLVVGTGTSLTQSNNAYRYSLDGTTWSAGTLPASVSPRALISNGSRIVLSITGSNTAYYTDNGTTWTAVTAWSNATPIRTDGIYDGTNFVLTARNSGGANNVRYSTDGITWQSISNAAQVNINVEAIGHDGSSRYIVGEVGGAARTAVGALSSSPTWNAITFPTTPSSIESIRHNGNVWLITTGGSANALVSSNGTTWTATTLPATFGTATTGSRPKIGVFQGKFYFLSGNGSTSSIWTSTNGTAWTQRVSGLTTNVAITMGWAFGEGKVVVVGPDIATGNPSASNNFVLGQ